MKNILLVNPWIYDFAAYDLWMKPWGLLKISAILKKNGFKVYLVDALDRQHPLINKNIQVSSNKTGKFCSEEVIKPLPIRNIPRKYKRYGLSCDNFIKALPEKPIDMILVSSGMTYWYPGVFEAIKLLKTKYGAPIVLGGIYASLMYKHAECNSGADYVIKNKELYKLADIIGKKCDFSFQNILNENIDYSWYPNAVYGVLRISLGCQFNCAYCAQKLLGPDFLLKSQEQALKEIEFLYKRNIRTFAFYDDALLADEDYITSYFEEIIGKGIKADFYTPNGLHARHISEKVATLMRKMTFINPILSLETSVDEKGKVWHDKVTKEELKRAVFFLKQAGYKDGEYTVYLLLGAPGSSLENVKESIDFVHFLGGKVSLSEFSPIPGARLAEKFTEALEEPLLQNNSVFPDFNQSEWKDVRLVKTYARKLNSNW
ncbi:MAG: B12-binding domain-containing radical SAM protein [Candidatus Omnitrophota bacterium]|nr:radical SAM protein [Candidatus Omnitrophota bacterium]MBU1894449.1 radical SAM protein [Candidatus Omnitrophota bacterium]